LPEPTLTGGDRLFGVPGEFEVSICPSCEAGITVPLVENESLAAFYPTEYDAYQRVSGRGMLALLRIYHAWRDRLTERTPPLSILWNRVPGRLLDVGCGKGEPSALLLRRGWSIVGIDPSPHACELARRRGIDARLGTLQTVNLEDDLFDAVLFHHSLEHVSDPLDDLERAARHLLPEGVLLVTVPNFGCWQRKVFGSAWMPLDLPRHRTHFTDGALRDAIEQCGLSVLSTSEQTTLSSLPLTVQFATLRRPLLRGSTTRRLMVGSYAILYPLSALVNRVAGSADVLTATAKVSKASSE
jgi:SAM-dependent methyltransferase